MTSLSTVPLSIKLLLFFLILCPGVYIGDVLLNICDVYIPVLFLYVLITRRLTYWYMNNTVRWLWLYVGVAVGRIAEMAALIVFAFDLHHSSPFD